MRVRLVPLDGGRSIELVNDLTLVGRQEGCDLMLDHKSVSKIHCVLVKGDGLVFLRDLGSTNGTRVNGQRIRRAALMSEDQLSIAKYGFRIVVERDGQPAKSPGNYECTINEMAPNPSHRVNGHANGQHSPAGDDDSAVLSPAAVQNNPLPDDYPDERH